MGQSFEAQRLSQDGGDLFGSGSLVDATVSGAVSMAPDSVGGVMSARACRVLARVCMLVGMFGVLMFELWWILPCWGGVERYKRSLVKGKTGEWEGGRLDRALHSVMSICHLSMTLSLCSFTASRFDWEINVPELYAIFLSLCISFV